MTKFATITGTAYDGINLTQGGSVSNAAGATISGSGGGSAMDDSGNLTVTNLGTFGGPGFRGQRSERHWYRHQWREQRDDGDDQR